MTKIPERIGKYEVIRRLGYGGMGTVFLARDPQLESRPTFLFFKGAANGLFAAGTEELTKGVDDRRALLIGIRCERGSHRFFKRYGERFEESEGKRLFLEFADAEREHLDPARRELAGDRAGCKREDRIAVHHRVRRHDRARQLRSASEVTRSRMRTGA